jgi:hypothetical protein
MSSTQLLESIVVQACLDLFAAYDVTLTATDDPPGGDGFALCGVIGFSADGARGMLMLAVTGEPIGSSGASGAEPERAWIAELANQMLGRVKNRALAHGATLTLATPLVLRGQHLAPVPRVELAPHQFRASTGGHVCLWFEVEVDDGFALTEQPGDVAGSVQEGDALLF